MTPAHNGPYIAACADKLGRKLTKDELIAALDCLAHEAGRSVEKAHNAITEFLKEWSWMDGPEGWREALDALRDGLDPSSEKLPDPNQPELPGVE